MGLKPNPKVVRGLRRLCRTRRHGQTFTNEEIAAECKVSPQAIKFIYLGAIKRLSKKFPTLASLEN